MAATDIIATCVRNAESKSLKLESLNRTDERPTVHSDE